MNLGEPSPHPDPLPSHQTRLRRLRRGRMGAERGQEEDINCCSMPSRCGRFMVAMQAKKREEAFHEPWGKRKAGRRLRAVRGFLPVHQTGLRLLTQELERDLRHGIGLRQHRRAGLHEDVIFGVVGALLRNVHVHDLAVGRRQVVIQRRELIAVIRQRLDVGADGRAIRRQLRDGVVTSVNAAEASVVDETESLARPE